MPYISSYGYNQNHSRTFFSEATNKAYWIRAKELWQYDLNKKPGERFSYQGYNPNLLSAHFVSADSADVAFCDGKTYVLK